MNKIQIRTTKTEGRCPLYLRIKIEDKSTWLNLMLQVDIQKWNAAAGSERKISNLLDKLDYTKKIQEIEFAIKDLRKRHKLTKESAMAAIDSVVLAERRAALLEKDKPYVYNRLYRLKSRISSSDAPDKELFLSLL